MLRLKFYFSLSFVLFSLAVLQGNDGKNMELNPRQVDISVTRPIGESLTSKDSQLDAAVRELLGEIGGK